MCTVEFIFLAIRGSVAYYIHNIVREMPHHADRHLHISETIKVHR